MTLDLTSLARAVERLEQGLSRYAEDTSDEQIRDGLIQRFEFTYKISHKMLRRVLAATSPNPAEIAEMTFQDLIRTANQQGLSQGEWTDWRTYREMRSRTSHTYDEAVALEVVKGIPSFLQEARYLLTKLSARIS